MIIEYLNTSFLLTILCKTISIMIYYNFNMKVIKSSIVLDLIFCLPQFYFLPMQTTFLSFFKDIQDVLRCKFIRCVP